MIGENIIIEDKYLLIAGDILDALSIQNVDLSSLKCISVSGESGSGKTTLATSLQIKLTEKNIKSIIFQMDDYFKLAPQSNHDARLKDLNHVGPQEVDLELLDLHLRQAIKQSAKINKPIVHYNKNIIQEEIINAEDIDIVIVEGTYTALLKSPDLKIFISRNYLDTKESRRKRNREADSEFLNNVLYIEHAIISRHLKLADIIVDKDNQVLSRIKNG